MTVIQGQTISGQSPVTHHRGRVLLPCIAMQVGGVLLLFSAAAMLWHGGHLGSYLSGTENEARVISIGGERPDPDNNGKLVHLSGIARSADLLRDPLLGVEETAIALVRVVEMFQWHEVPLPQASRARRSREGAAKVLHYRPEWSAQLVDSSTFEHPAHHPNPTEFPIESRIVRAENVAVAAFQLNAGLISQIGQAEPVALGSAHIAQLPERFAARADAWRGDWLYVGDPVLPAIGDLRMRLWVVRDQPVSILARQIDNTFEPYVSGSGPQIEHLSAGIVCGSAMLDEIVQRGSPTRRALRVLALTGIPIGIGLVIPFCSSSRGLPEETAGSVHTKRE